MKNDNTGVKKQAAAVFIITALCYAGILLYMVQAQKTQFETKGQEVITIWYWDDSIEELFEQYKKDTGSTYRLNYVNVSISDYARQIESAIDSPGEAMELFADWESLLNKSLEQKEKGHQFMLFNCLGDVGSMLFNQTDEPYTKENKMIKPERFLDYFRYLDKLYDTGLVGNTAQVSMEWSQDYWEETYMMAPWTFWVSQYDTFSVNEKEDWTLISPPNGSFKWGGMVLSIPSSSREKEAAWDFASYLAGSMEGAEANKRVKCRQLTYFGCEHGTEEYRTLEIEGFGNQDIGNYVSSELMSHRKERPLSSYDLELDEVFHLTIDAIIHEPELTPEELYAYFLRMLKKAVPKLQVPPI